MNGAPASAGDALAIGEAWPRPASRSVPGLTFLDRDALDFVDHGSPVMDHAATLPPQRMPLGNEEQGSVLHLHAYPRGETR